MQQWMARLVDGKSVVTQLTHNKLDSYGNMPSRFVDGKPPRVAYTNDWPIWKAKAAWIFADKPDEPHNLEGFDYKQMSMWSAVSPDFLTGNGLAVEARLKYNRDKQLYEPVGKAPGLPYLFFADVDNDGLLDVLAIGPRGGCETTAKSYIGPASSGSPVTLNLAGH